ncbi:hypothetical protein XENOCAPTIV_012480 [Xenoophorus captivus]|uniref:Myosin motor domain-containing protein n=1 Tax=Xenoophorus captivus TaxID=1517983 RepID=A0ABV0R1M2_9TELE
MHQSSIDGVEDMSALAELHEAAIMHNLYQRYQKDNIYTNIGSILAAVNPYKQIPGLYDLERVDLYSKHHLGELPPHIFAVANECYRCIWKRHDSQCVLISQSGCLKDKSLNDKELYNSVMVSLCFFLFSSNAFKYLSTTNTKRTVTHVLFCFSVVSNASDLLGLDAFQLSEVLTQRSIILRGEEICSPLTIEQVSTYIHFPFLNNLAQPFTHLSLLTLSLLQAIDSRDSVAMALYSQCFSWIILKINQKIKGKENFKSIGILDIFGFENFEVRTLKVF